jgi:outer membrane protein insertion porin family
MNERLLGQVKVTVFAIGLGALASGCSLFSVEDIPSPFPEDPPYGKTVREIRVEGNRHTKTWIVESAMASKVGEPYTKQTARNDARWLGQLGTFTSVAFSTEPVPDGIDLIVSVKEGTPYIPSVSFKLTQENGVEIGPAFSSPNFLGFAGRVSVYARFGGATNIGIRYRDPWLPGKSWKFGYNVEFFHRERTNELDNFNEKSDEAFLQVRRNLTNPLRLGARFSFMSVGSDVDGKTLNPNNRDNTPALGLFLELDTRNAPYPTSGWWNELEVTKYGIFGGDGDWWRFTGDMRRYVQLPFGSRHSLAIYSLFTMQPGEVGADLPVYMDFEIGGTNSVRGWPLGSRVGKNQWLNTLEYWFMLKRQRAYRFWFIKMRLGLQLGLFGDVGTAWNTSQEFGDNFIGGFGAGLRVTIPVVVLLRLDVGYSPQNGFSIAIGGAEKAYAQRFRVR